MNRAQPLALPWSANTEYFWPERRLITYHGKNLKVPLYTNPLHYTKVCVSYIIKKKYRPATTTAVYVCMYVTLRGPPLKYETGCTGELWSNCVLLILKN